MIYFHTEDINFNIPSPKKIVLWIKAVASNENQQLGNINVIFCSDAYLIKINQDFLDHNFFTDIITFDYSDNHVIEGDLFISINRIQDNAFHYNTAFVDELHRIIIHGLLHLFGYSDKDKDQQKIMRFREDFYLTQRNF
jgi:probable rRNA maturation factor